MMLERKKTKQKIHGIVYFKIMKEQIIAFNQTAIIKIKIFQTKDMH